MRILTAVKGRAVRPAARIAARRRYFEADRRACRAQVELGRDLSGQQRVTWLRELAYQLNGMADYHRAAFGPDPIEEEGGRDLAESLALSALLVLLVADAENAAVSSTPRTLTSSELEPRAGAILDRMAATSDEEERGELLDDLYDAVVDVVGGQAAETVACLPAPGHWGQVTLGEWVAAARAGSLSSLVAWRSLAIAAGLILASIVLGGWLGVVLGVAGSAITAVCFPRLWPHGWRWPPLLMGAAYGLVIASSSHTGRAEVVLVAAGAMSMVTGVAGWALATLRGERPA